MSKLIMEAVDTLTEGAITTEEDVLARRRKERERRKAERDAAKAEAEKAKREEMSNKYKPAFARGDEPRPSVMETPAEPEPKQEIIEVAPQVEQEPERKVGRPTKKIKRVNGSITLPTPLWSALDKYATKLSVETGQVIKSRSELIYQTLLTNKDLAQIYEEILEEL